MEILIPFGLIIATQLVKKFIAPKYGATGVQVFVFLLALLGVSIKGAMTVYPAFGELLVTAGTYLVQAIALYEVVYKRLSEKVKLF